MSHKPIKTMTRYERFMRRMAAREAGTPYIPPEREPSSPIAETPDEQKPTFDASSFTMTPAALALLQRVEAREKAAKGIEVARRMTEAKVERERLADENERKYGEQLTYADRMMGRTSETENNRYARIEGMAGRNGDCHSRKTTYRHQKYGKGNLSLRGYLKEGFEENISCRAL